MAVYLCRGGGLLRIREFRGDGILQGHFSGRKTGYRTFPVVFGWTPTAVYSDIVSLAAALSVAAFMATLGTISVGGIIVFGAALAVNAIAQVAIHRTRSESESHGPIGNVVRAFVLYCFAIVLACQPHWLAFLIVYYALFEFTLYKRPDPSQI